MNTHSPHSARLNGYLAWLRYERRYSDLTAENYARDLRQLFRLSADTPLDQLTPAQIRRFIAQLHGEGLGGRSLARMLSAWRGFFNYLIRDHGCTDNPCLGLRPPKTAKKLPEVLTTDQAVQLVAGKSATQADPSLAVRDQAMFELLYSSGLRLAELVALNPLDLDLNDGTVRVNGKGGKQRIVPVGTPALAAVRAWLEVRPQLAPASEPALFVGVRGKRISPRVVQLQLHRRGLAQGIELGVYPHMLRHSFASHILQSSGDLRAVQEMLGHASIASTQVYTHLDFQHLSKTYDSAHPRAKRKS